MRVDHLLVILIHFIVSVVRLEREAILLDLQINSLDSARLSHLLILIIQLEFWFPSDGLDLLNWLKFR